MVSCNRTPDYAQLGKIGKALRFAEEQGVLSKRVMLVWKLVKNCIGDEERCGAELKKGNEAISQVSQESSQKSETEGTFSEGNMSEDNLESIADSLEKVKLKVEPSAPGPRHPPLYDPGGAEGCSLHLETWRELGTQCFPVFQDVQGNRTHEPLDWKIVQRLAEGVRAYGVTAAYVVMQLESLYLFCMTPSYWQNLAHACLTSGQYLDWKAYFIEFAAEQAVVNARNGQQVWDQDMLLGQGRFVAAQINYPLQVYEQINSRGTRAWKSLPNRGEVIGNLTKINQGPTEPFADYVARMVEA